MSPAGGEIKVLSAWTSELSTLPSFINLAVGQKMSLCARLLPEFAFLITSCLVRSINN